jgi:hypothetical protein
MVPLKSNTHYDNNLGPFKCICTQTFSPIAQIASLKIMITLTTTHNLHMHQMDVKTTFLNGTPNEEIYMLQPKGFVHLNHLENVCRFFIISYGLKQSSQMWYERFNSNLF